MGNETWIQTFQIHITLIVVSLKAGSYYVFSLDSRISIFEKLEGTTIDGCPLEASVSPSTLTKPHQDTNSRDQPIKVKIKQNQDEKSNTKDTKYKIIPSS